MIIDRDSIIRCYRDIKKISEQDKGFQPEATLGCFITQTCKAGERYVDTEDYCENNCPDPKQNRYEITCRLNLTPHQDKRKHFQK